MNRPWRYLLPLLGLWLAVPVFAGDEDQLRCGVNQDRVWVYDTLTSFDVGARLKCGESVEIVSRVKGYVKIRNSNGVEGYVPDSALPDLPPLPDPDDKIVAGSAGPAPPSRGETSLAAASRKARGAAKSSPAISPTTTTDNPAASASAPAAPPQQQVAAASGQPPVAVQSTTAPTIVAAPEVATNSAPVPISVPAPVATSSPAPAPATLVVAASTAAAVVASNAKAASAPPPVAASAPTPAIAAGPLPAQALVSVATPVTAPAPVALVVTPGALSTPAVPSDTKTTSARPKSAKHSKSAPEHAATPSLPTPAPIPALAPARTPGIPVNEAKLEGPARTYPIRDIVTPSRAETAGAAVEVPIGSEYPDTQPENESADPACHTFFSAYGLSPSQFKWLAANRRKLYPGICPAPNLASVDFVVLFTHDSDTYNAAMPTPVHTDRAGFSDFNPMTTIDTALLSGPDADRAHREYVWVFRTRRGGFDPMKFSPRRRPQFSTTESKGSARAIEDAFNYLQEQGARLEAAQ